MSKYERFFIYPLLILVLAYGFLGNPSMQASQETAVFNRIEAKEIELKNDDGITVMILGPSSEGSGGLATYNKQGVLGASISTDNEGGIIAILDKEGDPGISIQSSVVGSGISSYNKDGTMGILIVSLDTGGMISTRNGIGQEVVHIGTTDTGHGGIWVGDRYGEFPAFYGPRR